MTQDWNAPVCLLPVIVCDINFFKDYNENPEGGMADWNYDEAYGIKRL